MSRSTDYVKPYTFLIGAVLQFRCTCKTEDFIFLLGSGKRQLIWAERIFEYVLTTWSIEKQYLTIHLALALYSAFRDVVWNGCHDTKTQTTGVVWKANETPFHLISKCHNLATPSLPVTEEPACSTRSGHGAWFRNWFINFQKMIQIQPKRWRIFGALQLVWWSVSIYLEGFGLYKSYEIELLHQGLRWLVTVPSYEN